jgi:hypothetical protein
MLGDEESAEFASPWQAARGRTNANAITMRNRSEIDTKRSVNIINMDPTIGNSKASKPRKQFY